MIACPNINDPDWKALKKAQPKRAYYLWNKYEGNVPKEFYTIPQVVTKPGIQELFNSNPELTSIGTPQQYSQYLDSIFPNSSIKDIVYHGAMSNVKNIPISDIEFDSTSTQPIWFTPSKKEALNVWANRLKLKSKFPFVIPAIINTTENYNTTEYYNEVENKTYSNLSQVSVFPNQIHILGNNQDIERFKKFVQSKQITRLQQTQTNEYEVIDVEKVKDYLGKLFPGEETVFYDFAREIGNKAIHGFVEDGVINLWSQAEVGSEFHEAYHKVFRFMLSDSQRQILYKDAEKQFGKPSDTEVSNLMNQFPNISKEDAYNLVLEEKMAEGFRDYMLSEGESTGILASIAKWFKDLFAWMKAMMTNNLALKDIYSLMGSTKLNTDLFGRKVLRNPEQISNKINPTRLRAGIPKDIVEYIVDGVALIAKNEIKANIDITDPSKKLKINQILGDKNNPGTVVNGLVQKLFKFKDDREVTPSNVGDLMDVFKVYRLLSVLDFQYKNATNPQEKAKLKEAVELQTLKFKEFRRFKEVEMNNYPQLVEGMPEEAVQKVHMARAHWNYIFNVIDNWNGKMDKATGNVLIEPWKNDVIRKLKSYGYEINIKTNDITDGDIAIDFEDQELTVNDGITEKVYGISHFSESPKKKLNERAKELLKEIPILKPVEINNKLRYQQVMNPVFKNIPQYYDKDYVYRTLSEICADTETWIEMEMNIRNFAQYRPDVYAMYAKIQSLNVEDKGLLSTAFNLTNKEFKFAITGQDSKLIDANSLSTAIKEKTKWRVQSVESEGVNNPNSRALYTKLIGNRNDEFVTVNPAKLNAIKRDFKNAYDLMKLRPSDQNELANFFSKDGRPNTAALVLGNLMWNLSMNLGSQIDKGDTIRNIQILLDKGLTVVKDKVRKPIKGQAMFNYILEQGNFAGIVKSMVGFITTNNSITYGDPIKNPIMYFDGNEKSGITFLSELTPYFLNRKGESFVTPVGTSMFPINLSSPLDDKIVNLKKNLKGKTAAEKLNALNVYRADKFMFNDLGPSFLFTHLLENEEYLEVLSTYNSSYVRDEDGDGMDVSTYGESDHYTNRIVNFINNGDEKYFGCIIPTQAERETQDFMTMPRLRGHIGTKNYSYSEIFTKQIIEDLYRINQAESVSKNPNATQIEDYHNGKKLAFVDSFMQLDGELEGKQIVRNLTLNSAPFKMSDLVAEYVKHKKLGPNSPNTPLMQEFEKNLSKMVSDLNKFYKNRAAAVANQLMATAHYNKIGIKNINKWASNVNDKLQVKLEQLVVDFLVHEDIGRNEYIKLYRGNRALFKNTQELTKRQRLVSTPKQKMYIKGTASSNPEKNRVDWLDEEYGANPTFTSITFEDLKGDITNTIRQSIDAWHTKTVSILSNPIFKMTGKDLANLSGFKSEAFKESDGLALISVHFYKSLMEGHTLWKPWHEAAYKNYLETGKFVYVKESLPPKGKAGDAVEMVPFKPYFEGVINVSGTVTSETHKTAYVVLTKDYTANTPILNDLRMRMELNPLEANNPYIGKNLQRIDVAQAKSAKKSYLGPAYDFRSGEGLDTAVVQTHATANLGFPQTIPNKSKTDVTFNVQMKKNGIANVNNSASYFFNAGLKSEQKVSGRDLKKMYHQAIEEKINRGFKSVEKKIGIDKFKKVIDTVSQSINATGKAKVNSIVATQEFQKAKLELLQSVRNILEEFAYNREMSNNYMNALDITIDPVTLIPRFTIPMDLPIFGNKFVSGILSMFNNEVFTQKLSGMEAVQTALVGGINKDSNEKGYDTSESLKFLEIVDHAANKNKPYRLVHAEILLREDVLRKFNLKPGDTLDSVPEELRRLIAYRIPNQDKASMIIFKIAGTLPAGYAKTIVVPPQVVPLMGSDFDVDKLFLLLPKVNYDENGYAVSKIIPDYKSIAKDFSMIKSLTDDEIDNILLDSIEAVLGSPEHFLETLTPLDSSVPKEIANELIQKNPEIDLTNRWTGGEYETRSALTALASVPMRGLHSNAVAGRNVAVELEVNLDANFAIKIVGEEINTTLLKNTPNLVDADTGLPNVDANIPTDKIQSRGISLSVDAVKDPIQHILNDNILTFPVILLWNNFHGNSRYLYHFLNQPVIRDFTELMANKYNYDLRSVYEAYNAIAEKYKIPITNDPLTQGGLPANPKEINRTLGMDPIKILNLQLSPAVALNNFMKMYYGGKQVQEFFKVITPDTSQGLNRLEAIQAFVDRMNKFKNPDHGRYDGVPLALYGRVANESPVEQLLDENSPYGLEKAYYELLNNTFNSVTPLFPILTSPEFAKFKGAIKTLSNNQALTIEQHRDINNAIMFTILTKADSPIRQYFEKGYSDLHYKVNSTQPTLHSSLQTLLKKYPNLQSNEYLSKLEEDPDNIKFTAEKFKTIRFDATQQFSKEEKERISENIELLLYNTKQYLPGMSGEDLKNAVNEITSFARKLVMHNFIAYGLKNTGFNILDLAPTKFYLQKFDRTTQGLEPISIANYVHEQTDKILKGNYFDETDLIRFFRMFGEIRPGGKNLVERYTPKDEVELKPVMYRKVKPGKTPANILVIRPADGDKSEIYILDTQNTNKSKAKYLSLYKTSNNKKHIVGGKDLDITKIGNESSVVDIQGLLNAALASNSQKSTPENLFQLCML